MDPKEITLAEVKEHNTPTDLWVVIHNKVYDLSKFRREHPGGEDPLDENAGKDATKAFIFAGHSKEAREMLPKYYIGDLAASDRKKKLVKQIGIAMGAVVLGIATVFIIRSLISKK